MKKEKYFFNQKQKDNFELKSCYDIKRPGNKADITNSILNLNFGVMISMIKMKKIGDSEWEYENYVKKEVDMMRKKKMMRKKTMTRKKMMKCLNSEEIDACSDVNMKNMKRKMMEKRWMTEKKMMEKRMMRMMRMIDDEEDDEEDVEEEDDDEEEPFNVDKYRYGGENYQKGKEQKPKLYCAFYEKHGFRENPALNTQYKCFDIDPLPAMEIKLKGEGSDSIHDLIKVFTQRKPLKPLSDFCSAFDKGKYIE